MAKQVVTQLDDMNSTDIQERPSKKRRFFFEDEGEISPGSASPPPDATPSPVIAETRPPDGHSDQDLRRQEHSASPSGFDVDLFQSVLGDTVPEDILQKLREEAGDDVQTAVNVYLDRSWERDLNRQSSGHADDSANANTNADANTDSAQPHRESSDKAVHDTRDGAYLFYDNPPWRYVGAFGVAGWATRSGANLIGHEEPVNIERAKIQPPTRIGRGGKVVARQSSQRGDVLTRFTNASGVEIGRLPQETAQWVSTLIDQKICGFKGVCVYAPDHIRVNDTIYIQLKCYLLRDAFGKKSLGENEPTEIRLFEQQETAEEKLLRLRQVALVTLFSEVNIHPTSNNDAATKHKKEGLLRAAEIADEKVQNTQSSSQLKDASDDSGGEDELEQDQLDSLYQKAQCFDFNTPEATPPDNFTMELRGYQKQALHWMLGKEKDDKPRSEASMHPLWEEYSWPMRDVDDNPLPHVSEQDKFYVNPYSGELSLEFPVQEQNCLGGILADEMGLGKTIEMLSLMHSHQSELGTRETCPRTSGATFSELGDPASGLSRSSKKPVFAPRTTLVVSPTSLLSQWESEAIKASKAGSMKVLVYYGNDKFVDLRSLCSSWNAQQAPDLVITSYGIVRSEHARLQTSASRLDASQTGLFSVEFFRIILDEAHHIKNRASKTARACYDLNSVHRWVLTGTPIVNRLEDLYSLVRFLRVEPWSNFSFWKTFITVPFESKDFARALNVVQTVLEPLVLRRTKTMTTPDGEALIPLPTRTINVDEVELPEKERQIYDLIFNRAQRTFNDNVAAGTLLKSYTTIFTQLLRLRQTCCHPMLTRNQDIVADEEDAAVATDATNNLKDDMDLQELIDQFSSSTEQASKEDQDPTSKFTAHALKQIQDESTGECPICSEEPMINPAVTACWHSACRDCLDSYIRHQIDKKQTPRCFSCRENMSLRDIFEIVRHQVALPPSTKRENSDDRTSLPSSPPPRISLRRVHPLSPSAQTSAKIHALINHLTRLPPNTKSVVFSQFTSFLDLIAPRLTRAGISHLRFDGTMHHKARAAVLAQFHSTDTFSEDDEEDDDEGGHKRNSRSQVQTKLTSGGRQSPPNVLLISLRAGGVGLNLTAANHVFMMDPWWSFAVEAQAIDRVHRMGQLHDVMVTRFVVKNSIEVRMLRVQERKMMIASSLGLRVGGDANDDDRRKERMEELKLLFE